MINIIIVEYHAQTLRYCSFGSVNGVHLLTETVDASFAPVMALTQCRVDGSKVRDDVNVHVLKWSKLHKSEK